MPSARPLAERFEEKVDRSPGHGPWGDCHVWTAAHNEKGYGSIGVGRHSTRKAHVVAFFLAYGRWPEPCCLHRCDNPPCVRLDHLFEGTVAVNTQDMYDKGRRGKLTADARAEIRRRVAAGETRARIAEDFAVTRQAIAYHL